MCPRLAERDGYCSAHEAYGKKKECNFSRSLSRHQRGYGSQWQKLRKVVLAREGALCQPCLAQGRTTRGAIVDHITPKADEGTDDLANLQVICHACHTMKTAMESARGSQLVQFEPDWLPRAAIPVVTVCGPPGSGKSTHVHEHAGRWDLVLDTDVIAAQMFDRPLYHAIREQLVAAIRYRNKMLASLAKNTGAYKRAWLIATAGSPEKRQFWQRLYGELVIMPTPKAVCVERVRNDVRRPDMAKTQASEAISRWA